MVCGAAGDTPNRPGLGDEDETKPTKETPKEMSERFADCEKLECPTGAPVCKGDTRYTHKMKAG
jgi:hypothetical protein